MKTRTATRHTSVRAAFERGSDLNVRGVSIGSAISAKAEREDCVENEGSDKYEEYPKLFHDLSPLGTVFIVASLRDERILTSLYGFVSN